ncbi:MAG: DUF6789 family protein [Xanthobacteraceae bacterium]
MSNSLRGMIAGLVATLVLTVVMQVKVSMGLWSDSSLIQLLINLGSLTTVQAWMDHFIIGVAVWGLVMGAIDGLYPATAHWLKGLIIGVAAWLLMMVAFMPLAKAGFFGSKLGPSGALVTLGYHVLYGLVLGIAYGLLTAWAPAKPQT